jgi:hypothetical protein
MLGHEAVLFDTEVLEGPATAVSKMIKHGGSNLPNHSYRFTELIAVMSTELPILHFCVVL